MSDLPGQKGCLEEWETVLEQGAKRKQHCPHTTRIGRTNFYMSKSQVALATKHFVDAVCCNVELLAEFMANKKP